MNVYDLDGTICYPDSAVHFAFWCMNRDPLMWITFFSKALKNLILYKKGKMTRTVMRREFYGFLKIRDFEKKLLDWFKSSQKPLCDELKTGKKMSKEIKASLDSALAEFGKLA